jgi:hypothetical protein
MQQTVMKMSSTMATNLKMPTAAVARARTHASAPVPPALPIVAHAAAGQQCAEGRLHLGGGCVSRLG